MTNVPWSAVFPWAVILGLSVMVWIAIDWQHRRDLASRIKGREVLSQDALFAAFADDLASGVDVGQFHRIVAAMAKAVRVAPGVLRPDDIILQTFEVPAHESRLRWLRPLDHLCRLSDFNIPQRIYEEIECEFDVAVDNAVPWDRAMTVRDLINVLVDLLPPGRGSATALTSLHTTPFRDAGRPEGEAD